MSKRKPKKEYVVDVDFYSVEYRIKAGSAAEARRIVKNKIKNGLPVKNINHIYIDLA